MNTKARDIMSLATVILTSAFLTLIPIAGVLVMTGHTGLAAQFLYLVFFYPPATSAFCGCMALALIVLIYNDV